MTSPPPGESGRLIANLDRKVMLLEGRLEDLTRALYGYPALGQSGFREEMERRVQELSEEVAATKTICEDLRMERRDELAERRGIKRVIGYTGITSVLTLLTLLALIISIWRGAGIGV